MKGLHQLLPSKAGIASGKGSGSGLQSSAFALPAPFRLVSVPAAHATGNRLHAPYTSDRLRAQDADVSGDP